MLDTTKRTTPMPETALPSPREQDIEAILGVGRHSRSGLLRPRNLIWAAIVAVAAAGLAYWSMNGRSSAVRYAMQPVTRGDLTVIVTATGSAQPITQVNISSELSGTVRNVDVDYNSQVKIGQPLAELDTDKLKATVANSKAKLDSAKAKVADALAQIEQTKGQYERKVALAEKQAAAAQDLDLAKAAYDRAVAQHASALAEVDVAEADLELNEINLAKAVIRSPINGVVLQPQCRSRSDGRLFAAGAGPVRHRRRPAATWSCGSMSTRPMSARSRSARRQRSTSMPIPDRKFPAVIRDIRYGSEVVQGVVTYKAVLSIDNSELLVRPGMTATAEIVVQQVKDALLVPNAGAAVFAADTVAAAGPAQLPAAAAAGPAAVPPAEQTGGGGRQTAPSGLLRENAPVAVPVAIGASDGRRTEILKGDIKPGDRVIVDTIAAKR